MNELFEMGAAVVVFDAVFAEPDRTSPLRLLDGMAGLTVNEALRREIEQLPDHDAVLAEVLRRGRVVTGFVFTDDARGAEPRATAGFSYGGDPFAHLFPRSGTVVNLPALEAAASGNGSFTVDPDPTASTAAFLSSSRIEARSTRRWRPRRSASRRTRRAYSLKTADSSGEASFGEQHRHHAAADRAASSPFPPTPRGEIWVWYTQPVAERFVPAWQVLAGEVRSHRRSRATSCWWAPPPRALRDVRATPLDPVSSGVTVHAQIIEQILLGEYLERPDWATGAELLYLFALGLPLALLIPRAGAVGTALLGGGGIAVAVALSWYAYSAWRWLLDPIYPGLAALGVYLVGSLQNFLQSEAQRRSVRSAFSRYLSPTLVDELAANPARLRLGGEMRDMTLLFCDVRGFTTHLGAARPPRAHAPRQSLPHADDRHHPRSARLHRQVHGRLRSWRSGTLRSTTPNIPATPARRRSR